MTDLLTYLKERPYPGRGILLGATPGGKAVCAYFIMGRSENSRNRVFEKTDDGIRTRAWDESKMTDPSLIIYHPVRRMADGTLIVTNGDQTDTVRDFLAQGKGWLEALCSRTFEPDEPNWTPRVSGLIKPAGAICSLSSRLRAESRTAASAFSIPMTRPRPAWAISSAPMRASAPRCPATTGNRSRRRCRTWTPPRWRRRCGTRWMRTTACRSTYAWTGMR